MGTPVWGAPEQVLFRGAAEVDQRADIYSLGLMLYTMLTGNLEPYESVDLARRQDGLLAELRGRKPDNVSPELWRIVENCLKFNPAERAYSTYSDLLTDLIAIV